MAEPPARSASLRETVVPDETSTLLPSESALTLPLSIPPKTLAEETFGAVRSITKLAETVAAPPGMSDERLLNLAPAPA